ncbi:hypothetical protein BO71DRAFT_132180 [Aspergillus ellipticus CBS 707.79]|uniref:Uncharacterized protein n=1 Tax=Aspergillus ellipticus CBS 707.79 TaxID=1448320 RepID=A0A319DKK3_9EURO|nr:hypothetical protein BO71DRAFT_132180 [Aspergillus ellipticus CBS 707.79]
MPSGSSSRKSRLQKEEPFVRPETFWDNLSQVVLTRSALQELQRRIGCPKPGQRPSSQSASNILRSRSPRRLKAIKRYSLRGGPDTSDLRSYPQPITTSLDSSSEEISLLDSAMARRITAYSANFEQHLIDHGIYPSGYEYPDGQEPEPPENQDAIHERLAKSRLSLSCENFASPEFKAFKRTAYQALSESQVVATVIPLIEGKSGSSRCTGASNPFTNLAPLTDGTVARARPDMFDGARPETLNKRIRTELSDRIIPASEPHLPMAPNLFLEVKGPHGDAAVALRQACYDAALGSRGMHALQSFQKDKNVQPDDPSYDNNAYTISSTYVDGQLKLFTTHLAEPTSPRRPPQYIMTDLGAWAMTGNKETFRQGATAYRNARDWAKKCRDEFIARANERVSQDRQSRSPSTPDDDDDDQTDLQSSCGFGQEIFRGRPEHQDTTSFLKAK